ncbi:MAG: cation diffusion facilitator family transporter [Clostridia bacterium]
MTQLLVKLFIKNNENTSDSKVRTSYGVLAGIVGIICNLILVAIKLAIGYIIGSISVTADAFNNLSDAGSSLVSLFGAKLAQRPADAEHPFGHGRAEYVAALVVAFLILHAAITLATDSFNKILNPASVGFDWMLVIILCVSILIKVWMMIFNGKLGKRINSGILMATASDSRNDIIVTSLTIVSVVIEHYTGFKIDGFMGLLVSVFVLLSGFKIAKDTLVPLLGAAVDQSIYKKITEKVESYEGIIGSHDLIVHNYGPSHIMATIHAEIPNSKNMDEAHDIIDSIERDVLKEMGIYLVIHMDPEEVNDIKVFVYKNMVVDVVGDLDPKATIHDFRVTVDKDHTNLIFDLAVPITYSVKQEDDLIDKIRENISKMSERYRCEITLEHSYVSER